MTLPRYGVLFAFAAALLSCMIWAGNFAIARGVHDWVGPMELSFWRWSVALVTILPIGWQPLRREWSVVMKHWKYIILMGAFGIGSFNSLIYLAAHYTSTHHIALISSVAPIGTLLLVGLLGIERLSRYKVCGALCAFMGALVVISHGDIRAIGFSAWNKGDLILLVSTSIWAVWSVSLTYKPKGLSTRAFLTAIIAVGVLWIIPFYLWELDGALPTPWTVDLGLVYLYLGCAASVVAWFLWQYAVDHIGALKTSLIYYSMPIFSGILAIYLLGEPLAAYHVLGFILVCGGIVLSNLRKLGVVE